jgi:methionyl-tRNA formyltransferase
VHILSPAVLDAVTGARWNIHGGLSPWYRGAITHFWPSYMLEPQLTGMTVHELTAKIDGGAIVHQSVADLVSGDGIHDLACRAVLSVSRELPELLERASAGTISPPTPQKTSGKLWLGSDWRPEHLRLIYDLYENRVVDRYLAGQFEKRSPPLVRQFAACQQSVGAK